MSDPINWTTCATSLPATEPVMLERLNAIVAGYRLAAAFEMDLGFRLAMQRVLPNLVVPPLLLTDVGNEADEPIIRGPSS